MEPEFKQKYSPKLTGNSSKKRCLNDFKNCPKMEPKGRPGDTQNHSRGPLGGLQGTLGGSGVPSGPPGGDLGYPRGAPDTELIPKSTENNEK